MIFNKFSHRVVHQARFHWATETGGLIKAFLSTNYLMWSIRKSTFNSSNFFNIFESFLVLFRLFRIDLKCSQNIVKTSKDFSLIAYKFIRNDYIEPKLKTNSTNDISVNILRNGNQ